MTRRQRHIGRWVAIPDGIGTAAVLDRSTDEPVVSGLPAQDAELLARDWNKNELPPSHPPYGASCPATSPTAGPDRATAPPPRRPACTAPTTARPGCRCAATTAAPWPTGAGWRAGTASRW